jgi:hypothetical protein
LRPRRHALSASRLASTGRPPFDIEQFRIGTRLAKMEGEAESG